VTSARDAYKILQVDPEADEVVIRAAYHALARKLHPDAQGGRADHDPRMAELNVAYASIRDQVRRAQYDRERVSGAGRRQAPVVTPPPPPPPKHAAARTTLDFGRYEGWTLDDVARRDPDYLRWLQRHSSGAPFRSKIEELLRTKS
jgi:curved DNA-binding protein CbpA